MFMAAMVLRNRCKEVSRPEKAPSGGRHGLTPIATRMVGFATTCALSHRLLIQTGLSFRLTSPLRVGFDFRLHRPAEKRRFLLDWLSQQIQDQQTYQYRYWW